MKLMEQSAVVRCINRDSDASGSKMTTICSGPGDISSETHSIQTSSCVPKIGDGAVYGDEYVARIHILFATDP